MIVLETTRRASKSAIQRLRKTLLEYDRVAFKDVFPPAEDAIRIVRKEGTYVLVIDDPTMT